MVLLWFIVCAALLSAGFALLMLKAFGPIELPKYDPHKVRQLEKECFGEAFTACAMNTCSVCNPKALPGAPVWDKNASQSSDSYMHYTRQLRYIEERVRNANRFNS